MSFNNKSNFTLSKKNKLFIYIGSGLMLLGYLLMLGGASKDPNVFDYSAIYSFQRITLAPILIMLGVVTIIIGIVKKFKPNSTTK